MSVPVSVARGCEVQGGISELAQNTGLNKQNLYRMLSEKRNPPFSLLKAVLHSIGLEMDVKLIKKWVILDTPIVSFGPSK